MSVHTKLRIINKGHATLLMLTMEFKIDVFCDLGYVFFMLILSAIFV